MNHQCHAKGCKRKVPPEFLMCRGHWRKVPPEIQEAVWKHYRRGQEVTKDPSRAYIAASVAAIDAVAKLEGKQARLKLVGEIA